MAFSSGLYNVTLIGSLLLEGIDNLTVEPRLVCLSAVCCVPETSTGGLGHRPLATKAGGVTSRLRVFEIRPPLTGCGCSGLQCQGRVRGGGWQLAS